MERLLGSSFLIQVLSDFDTAARLTRVPVGCCGAGGGGLKGDIAHKKLVRIGKNLLLWW